MHCLNLNNFTLFENICRIWRNGLYNKSYIPLTLKDCKNLKKV